MHSGILPTAVLGGLVWINSFLETLFSRNLYLTKFLAFDNRKLSFSRYSSWFTHSPLLGNRKKVCVSNIVWQKCVDGGSAPYFTNSQDHWDFWQKPLGSGHLRSAEGWKQTDLKMCFFGGGGGILEHPLFQGVVIFARSPLISCPRLGNGRGSWMRRGAVPLTIISQGV